MSDLYRFTIVGSNVTEVYEVERGQTSRESIDPNESYSLLTDGTVRKVSTYGSYREIEEYADSNADGIYTKVRKFYESDTNTAVNLEDNDFQDDDRNESDKDKDDFDDDFDNDGRDDDKFNGSNDDDRVYSSLGRDELHGGVGHDFLDGGNDDDDLFGEDDDDDLFGNEGNDYLDGGDGDDDLAGDDGDDELFGGAGNDSLTGGDGDDSVNGSDGDDFIVGGSGKGKDDYDGGNGIDTLTYASAVNAVKVDLYRGDASGRDIDRDSLKDIENVIGGSGKDRILGDLTANSLYGGAGNDYIDARSGDDYLVGGLGKDHLKGGSGADTFAFLSASESLAGRNRDLISDFRLSQGDKIDLSVIDADLKLAGDQSFAIVNSFSSKAGELTMRGKIISGDTDGDGIANFEIQVVGLASIDLSEAVII